MVQISIPSMCFFSSVEFLRVKCLTCFSLHADTSIIVEKDSVVLYRLEGGTEKMGHGIGRSSDSLLFADCSRES